MSIANPVRKTLAPRLGRSDRSALGRWFWEIDKVLLVLVAVLIVIGLIAVAAASPAASQRYSGGGISVPPLYYFYRQLMWIALAVPVMIAVSMLPKSTARRLSILGAAFFILCLFLVPILGVEVNGARRWLGAGFAQFQPSEFLKPLFIVTIAWLLSFKEKDDKKGKTADTGLTSPAYDPYLIAVGATDTHGTWSLPTDPRDTRSASAASTGRRGT